MINQLINLDQFKIIKKIGEGSYSKVYLVQNVDTEEIYSAKITKVECKTYQDQQSFFQEITAFSKVKSNTILPFLGFNLRNFSGEAFPTIITQYMSNKSLDDHFKSKNDIPQSKKYIILLGISLGMKVLHNSGIIHRDLKPANVLLDDNFYPYICDFTESKTSENQISSILMETYRGTPLYMAPEISSEKPYTYKTDVYSFSLIAYQLLTGIKPFSNYKVIFKLLSDVKKGKRPDLTVIDDANIQLFLSKCWSSKPDERPNFDEIVEEIKGEKYKKIMNADETEIIEYENFLRDGKILAKKIKDIKELETLAKTREKEQTKPKEQPYESESENETIKFKEEPNFESNTTKENEFISEKESKIEPNTTIENEFFSTEEEVAIRIKKSADLGDPESMFEYARLLSRGEGVQKNKEEAANYYKLAADKGMAEAMNSYAFILSKGEGVSIDKAKSVHYYKMAADRGITKAMYNYALKVAKGEGVQVNKKEASRYFKMAADKGLVEAMHNYSLALYEGEGVDVNVIESARYCKMAAEKGKPESMYNYARMLINGEGVNVDREEAAHYFKLAADEGVPEAMHYYACMKMRGEGVSADKEEANKYFKMAADNGIQIKEHKNQCLIF